MASQEDPELRAAVLGAVFTVPDGQPLVWALNAARPRAASPRLRARPDGTRLRARRAHRHALLPLRRPQPGRARPARAATCASAIPGLQIVGGYSPPFRDARADEEARRRSTDINALRRRRRVGRHRRAEAGEVDGARCATALDAPVLVGVGAAFDFHAGLVPQAPGWMQRLGPRVGVPARAASRAGCGGATSATTRASCSASRASTRAPPAGGGR